MSSSERIARAALSRCITSKYDDGSSNMYTSARCTRTTPMAKRCSSPPDSLSTSRSKTAERSKMSIVAVTASLSSFFVMMSPTLPLTALGM
mmetsp:Transcript_42404/g.99330  ORF Transcript_42404/g.99330 Transcript_42404/m.99330 type:complete len:91 (-) Transcript_42404:705-977(-)